MTGVQFNMSYNINNNNDTFDQEFIRFSIKHGAAICIEIFW